MLMITKQLQYRCIIILLDAAAYEHSLNIADQYIHAH